MTSLAGIKRSTAIPTSSIALPAAGPGRKGRTSGRSARGGFALGGGDPFPQGGGLGGGQFQQTQCPPGTVPAPGGGCRPTAGGVGGPGTPGGGPGPGPGGFADFLSKQCGKLPTPLAAACRTAVEAGEAAAQQFVQEVMGFGRGGGQPPGGGQQPPPGQQDGSRLRMVGRIGYNPTVKNIQRRTCQDGDVLAEDGKCYPKAMVPKKFREWRPAPKPKISRSDWKKVQRAATIEKRLKKMTKKAPGLKTARNR